MAYSPQFNVRNYGAIGDGSTDDGAKIQLALNAAAVAGGTVNFPAGNYKVNSSSRTDTVSYSAGNVFNDVSAASGDVGKYVLWANLGRVAKITAVSAGVSFTVDVLPLTTTATTAKIVAPGFVIPEGVSISGVGSNFNHQLTSGASTSVVTTQVTDGGTGVTALIQGANSPAGGSTRYGLFNMSVLGNAANICGLFVGNGAWLIDSRNLELSSHGVAGLMLDGNINSHNFSNLVLYGNGSSTATTATGGVFTHPYNAAGSASCNFYNAFFSANKGFGIFDGDTGGSYGVVLWDPQFNSQQVSAMANSGTSMVLQSKGTGDGMGICVGGWSETAALYDVITSGYVTIVGMRMHSSNAYHWIVNGGIGHAIGCTFEGAATATAQLNSSGVFTWDSIKCADSVLYSGGPAVASLPSIGTSGTLYGKALTAGGFTNTGDFTVKDAATATKAMRFQTSAAALDVAFGGATNYISNWTGADFTGTQKFYMAFDTAGNFDAFQVWRWHTAPFASTTVTIDSGSTSPLQLTGSLLFNGATSGTTTLAPTAAASGALTLPAATDTLVGRATTDTLTNKTLTSPVINNPTVTGFGGITAITASTAAINTTETVVVTGTIPTATAGSTYRLTMYGTTTSTVANVSTWTLRAGTAGTTADAAVATVTLTAAVSGTSNPFKVEILFTLRSNGTTGAGVGYLDLSNNGTTGISTAQSGVVTLAPTSTFNTTSATKLTVSYKTAATTTTTTFQNGVIEIVKP